jgi:hypothetical protein
MSMNRLAEEKFCLINCLAYAAETAV